MICPDFAALRKTLRAHRTPVLLLLLGCAVQAFGLFNIHAFSGVTEGGVLGATLLIAHHFGVSPSVSSFVLNALCYAFGYRVLGRRFIVYSILSGIGFSLFYALFESMGLLLPEILYLCFVEWPWTAAILGAVFIGIGAGLCVRVGGAPGGDDALAMGLAHLTGWDIQWIYLGSDLLVLGLSVTYLSYEHLLWSLVSVVLSGQIIGWVQKTAIHTDKSGRTS